MTISKQSLIILVAVLVSLTFAISALAQPDFIQEIPVINGSFEQPIVQKTPPGWTSNGELFIDRPWTSVSDEQSFDGDYSLKMTGRKGGGSAIARSDLIAGVAGGLYTASAMAYAMEGKEPHPRIYLEFWDSEEQLIVRERAISTGVKQQWVQVNVKATAPDNAAYVSIWFYTNTDFDDVVYWDDVQLTLVRP